MKAMGSAKPGPFSPGRLFRPVNDAGFTRIELLGVVLAVFLVALIGLPSLGRAHSKSELAGCLSNQRHLLQAFQLYAQDNQDAWVASTYQGPQGSTELNGGGYWPGPVPDITRNMSSLEAFNAAKAGLARGPLWPYASAAEWYHCPADHRMSALRPGLGWGFDSYAKSEGIGTGTWSGIRSYRRMGEVRNPSATLVLIESADPRDFNRGTWVMNVSPPGWVDVVAAFHEGGSLSALADGHCEFRRWSDATLLKASRDSMSGTQAFFPSGGTSGNPDFVWLYNRFQHLDWRPLP